jgi:thiazole synthase ThiGH ThiG subunit
MVLLEVGSEAFPTIKHRLLLPLIVDAGGGTASDACATMEQGVDGIVMNGGMLG